MTTTAFITGISGFLGQALARYLIERGVSVSGLARSAFELDGATVVRGEIVHPASYAGELSRSQIVVHLAAPTLAAEINANPLESLKVNWRGTSYALDCFRSGSGEHFVFMSSGKVYGASPTLPVSEEMPLHPTTVLGKCKRAAEDLVRFYAEFTEKRFTILRLFNAYGPGQRPGFLVPTILSQIEKPPIVLGDVSSRRDFIYIDDVIEAIGAVLFDTAYLPSGTDRAQVSTFNVGSGMGYSPAELVAVLEEITGRSLPIEVDKGRLRSGELHDERADTSRLKALGWQAKVPIEEGLERTWRSMVHGRRF